MKSPVYTFNAAEVKVIPLDVNRPQFSMSLQTAVSGVANYSVYQTAFNVFTYINQEQAAADDIWLPVPEMSGITTSQDFSLSETTCALKVVINSISAGSNVRMTVTQQGLQ